MKKIIYLCIIGVIIFSFSCKTNTNTEPRYEKKEEKGELTIFWTTFQNAVKNNDYFFLIQNSLSKIECLDCGIIPDTTEWYPAELVFGSYLEKIVAPSNKDYIISHDVGNVPLNQGEKIHYINYIINGRRSYNKIYSIIEKEKEFKFRGMFTVP